MGSIQNSQIAPLRKTTLVVGFFIAWTTASIASNWVGIWPSMGSIAIVLGIVTLVCDRAASRTLLRPAPRPILIGVLVGGFMTVATHIIYPEAARLIPQITSDTALLYAAFRSPSTWVSTLCIAPVIIGEELVWRGVVQSEFGRRFGPVLSIVLTAICYTVAHIPMGSPVLVLVALGCGLAWGALRAATNSLLSVIVAHLLWDILVLIWLPIDMG
jgi:membrane protease YdiL (CAAX protease family)